MRLVACIGVVIAAGTGACLRDTVHVSELDDASDIDGAAGISDGPRIDGVVVDIDASTGLIEHVRLEDEMLGTFALSITGDRALDTTMLEYGNSTQPWLTLITTDQGNPVALARLDSLTIEQGKTLDVIGGIPLVIIARQIDMNGTIDASANGSTDGPGAFVTGTAVGGDGMQPATSDDSGGGGGGFGTDGAAGGIADTTAGGAAGASSGDSDLTRLTGGGRGGRGGATGCARALGGGGGGGLQLYASSALSINGTIDVSGGGGRRNGTCSAGGGGGGAGGAIYIQSSGTVTLGSASRLAANGGAGASGGGQLSPGSDGGDGVPGMFASQGGNMVAGGATGGAGGVLVTAPVDGGTGTLNGGGAGGAVGRIVVHAPMVTSVIGSQQSPAFVRRN